MKFFPRAELPITPALLCLLAGNLLDGIFTLVLLQVRDADEVNTILAFAHRVSPLMFMAVKICFVHGSILIVMLLPHQGFKRWFIRVSALVYGAVVAYQCVLLLASRH